MKKYTRFFEEIIPDFVYDELKRYVKDAGKRLNTYILDKVEQFKPDKPITIYRGMGFEISDASNILKKLKIKEPKIGTSCIYKTGKIQSWSLNKEIAKDFAGIFIFGRMRDASSLGIILEIKNIDPKDIAVPIAYINKKLDKPLPFSEQEEILIHPGTYKATVVDFIGDWESSSQIDLKLVIKELSLKAQKKIGGVLKKTWNKEAGFNLSFPEIYYDIKNKWSPAIEVHIDGMLVYIEIFGDFKNKSFTNKSLSLKNDAKRQCGSVVEVKEYLQSKVFFEYIEKAYILIKQLYLDN